MNEFPRVKVPPMIPIEKLADASWEIVEISGPHKGASFDVDRCIRIGRNSTDCNLVFAADTPGVSKVHCELIPEDNGVLIRDLNSTYGTYLGDGSRLSQGQAVLLKRRDTFFLASRGVSFQVL